MGFEDGTDMSPDKPPYFMTNREWYVTPEDEGSDDIFFDDDRGYHIRDDAPEEAKRSYEEFYRLVETPLDD